MGYVLIAPEMVILWAARQHLGAKYLTKRHQSCGWTMTHAFFVIMGGFTLHDKQGTPLQMNSRAFPKRGESNGHRSPRQTFKIGARAITSQKESF